MAHVLARLKGVNYADIRRVLVADSTRHAEQGLYLEHLWRNIDDANEILFLFWAGDIGHAREFIDTIHARALHENPQAKLPNMVFLEEE
ncbi:MAG: hypothetical protein EPN93_12290 [Spirochaetes bacterium]|nr:MAG: hypothetical protein EPN93_12290 [Spirochaetota bacterium]